MNEKGANIIDGRGRRDIHLDLDDEEMVMKGAYKASHFRLGAR